MPQLKFYKPSGKSSPIFVFHLAAMLFLIIPMVSYIYARITWWSPFIILSGVAAFFFAVTFSFVVRYMLMKGKVRNVFIARAIGLLSSLWFGYLQWAVWLKIAYENIEYANLLPQVTFTADNAVYSAFELAGDPEMLGELLVSFSQIGFWGFKEFTIAAWVLWIAWLLEMYIFIYMSRHMAKTTALKPFSEILNEWHETHDLGIFKLMKKSQMESLLQAEHLDQISTLPSHKDKKTSHSELTLYTSDDNNYIEMIQVIVKKDHKGQRSTEKETLIPFAELSKAQADAFLSIKRKEDQ